MQSFKAGKNKAGKLPLSDQKYLQEWQYECTTVTYKKGGKLNEKKFPYRGGVGGARCMFPFIYGVSLAGLFISPSY